MGITDKKTFNLKCVNCGATESGIVVEKGSSYGASWNENPKFTKFNVDWDENAKYGPSIMHAVCNECQLDATISET